MTKTKDCKWPQEKNFFSSEEDIWLRRQLARWNVIQDSTAIEQSYELARILMWERENIINNNVPLKPADGTSMHQQGLFRGI